MSLDTTSGGERTGPALLRRLLVALCAGVIAIGLVWAAAAVASLGEPFVPTGVLLVGAGVAFGALMGASAIGIVLVSLLDPMIWLGAIIMVALAGMIGIGAAPVVLTFVGAGGGRWCGGDRGADSISAEDACRRFRAA